MLSSLIGLATGLVTILGIRIFLKDNERLIYALVLSGIGFLYVGYTWMDTEQLIITCVQAIVFLLLAAYGMKNIFVLATGYFLHGIWDVIYNYFTAFEHVPPHYDGFCFTVDVVMGAYLLIFKKRMSLSI
jgi:hypothetical protein